MKNNVTPLRATDLTPELLLQNAIEGLEQDPVEEIYVVGFSPDGKAQVWACGDIASGAAKASLVLGQISLDAISGDIAEV